MSALLAFLRKISDQIERTAWLNTLLYVGASLVLAGACLSLGYLVGIRQEQGNGLRILSQAQQLVQQHFYGEVPPKRTLEYGMIHGMLGTLDDPYSGFSEPINAELQQNDMAGRFGGIGCTIQRNEQGEVLLSPYRESPAALAGIPDQAILLRVDEQEITAEMSLDAVVALVRGEVGTPVGIGFRTPAGEAQEVTITRAEFEIPSTIWRTLPDQPQIGYIHISRFSARTAEETAQALDELQVAGVTGLILDLRDNGGGLLDSAVAVFALFSPGGTVLIEEAKNVAPKTYTAPNKQKTTLPILLLVNQNTASASEILAGALQDHQRAQLVGVKTFGKGSVQFVFELADHSSIRITHAHWFTPNHNPIHEVGLMPDFVVENDPNQPDNDVQLIKALEILAQ